MKSKVLITGATGFVGKELCARLLAGGNEVIGLGRSVEPVDLKAVHYHQLDLESDSLAQLMAEDVECVVHLAGQAHGKGGSGKQQLDGFRRANRDVSVKLATEAISAGVRRFVFVSTIGVHGAGTSGVPISEDSPFHPVSFYAQSKLEAERELVKLFEAVGSAELTIVRPPLVYGAQAPGNFGSLLKLAHSSLPLPFGMCSNRRNIISLTGLVDFLVACTRHPGAGNQAFVVADNDAVSTKQIVAALRIGMARPPRLMPVPPSIMAGTLGVLGKREMYNQLFCDLEVQNNKVIRLVGWTPCVNTEKELERVGKIYADSRV